MDKYVAENMLLMLSAMYPYFINKVVERDAENGKKEK